MSKMLGYDLSSDGHHLHYNLTVMQHLKYKDQFEDIGYCTLAGHEKLIAGLRSAGIRVHSFPVPPGYGNGRLSLRRRTLLLAGMLLCAKKYGYDKVHLFHLDSNIVSLALLWPLLRGLRLTGTLHWYPNRKLKRFLLMRLLQWKAVDKVVVHGNFTHARMLRDGCDVRKVSNIHVPYFKRHHEGPESLHAEALGVLAKRKRPFLLIFGGMRHDKGIDILMESLAMVKDLEFTVIVAGAEDHFKEEDLDRWAWEYGLEGRIYKDIRYVPEPVKNQYFELCDAVVLPYRSMFSGISGPLTEGAANGKFVLGPATGEIGYTIETYRLGETFEPENRRDLADKLRRLLNRLHRGSPPKTGAAASLFARYIRDEKLFGENYRAFLA